MSDATSSSHEGSLPRQELSTMQALLDYNLRQVVGYSKTSSSEMSGYGTLFLKKPDGSPGFEVNGECGPENRAMLDKLYQVSHADLEGVVTRERTEMDETTGKTRYMLDRLIPAGHGFYFCESYVRDGIHEKAGVPWEEFTVSYSDVVPLPFRGEQGQEQEIM